MLGTTELKYERESGAVFVDFPETLKAGREVAIEFFFSGTPVQKGRFGGFTFSKDPKGRPWIYSSCEGQGASVWWPNKDQWRDRVDSMDISIEIPSDLVDVSNGKFLGKKDIGDGFTRWNWHVSGGRKGALAVSICSSRQYGHHCRCNEVARLPERLLPLLSGQQPPNGRQRFERLHVPTIGTIRTSLNVDPFNDPVGREKGEIGRASCRERV